MPNDDLRRIEAVLFAAERPLTRDEIALYMPEGSDIAGLLASLGESYAGRGVELAERGGKWHFQPAPDMGHLLCPERVERRRWCRAATQTHPTSGGWGKRGSIRCERGC